MKAFFSTLVGMIVVIILAAVVIGFVFWSRVPDIVANNLSKKLKVNVQIDDIRLGWSKLDIEKVEIGNTPHAILSKAFACHLIRILTPLNRYFDKQVIIDEIDINDVYLGLEFDSPTSTKGNWTEIMKNLQSTTGAKEGAKKKKGGKEAAGPSSRSVLIHKLILTNINVDVVYRKDSGRVQHLAPIDRIELTEISSEGGMPVDQIMNSVLGQMLKSVFEKENLKNMLQDLMQQQGGFQKYLEPFKGLFNAAPQEVEEGSRSA